MAESLNARHISDPQLGWLNQWSYRYNPILEQIQRAGFGALCVMLRASRGIGVVVDVGDSLADSMPRSREGFWCSLVLQSANQLSDPDLESVRASVQAGYDRLFEEPNLSSTFGESQEVIEACKRALRVVPSGMPRDQLWVPSAAEL